MKQLYSAHSGLEAHEIRLFLESRGIQACVLGETGLEVGIAFTPSSASSVYVDERNLDEARILVAEFQQSKTLPAQKSRWKCSQCGEQMSEQFDACWNCGTVRDDQGASVALSEPATSEPEPLPEAAVSPPTPPIDSGGLTDHDRRETWLEVTVVLSIVWLPYFAFSLLAYLFPYGRTEESFLAESIWSMVNFVPSITVVLYMIQRGVTGWQVHGLRKPRLVGDIVAGFVILVASYFAVWMVSILGVIAAAPFNSVSLDPVSYDFARPSTAADYFVLVLLSIAIGFTEELAMRGYLIPRFEQLLLSTRSSIFLSSVVFSSYHLYQGVEAALSIFVMGLVFGAAFCLTRRLWPVVIAHAMADILAMGSLG